MIKNLKYSFILIFSALLFNSCAEDLGNYDYKEINEVLFSGVESHYNVLLGDTFEIKPELNFTLDNQGDENNYEYEWYAQGPGDDIVLGTEKDLVIEAVQLIPGEYNVRYRVTDKDTGVQWNTQFYLDVKSAIYEGWMVLCDDNGTARLDMLSLINDEYRTINDVLDFAGSSLKLEGAPKFVYCYSHRDFYGIYVTSEDTGTTRIHPDTFEWKPEYYLSYEMMTLDTPLDYGVDFMNIASFQNRACFIYKDGDIFQYNSTYFDYGIPNNTVLSEAKNFKAAPFIAECFLFCSIIYDADNQRFLKIGYNQQSCYTLPEGDLFDYNTGKDMVYMTYTYYNGGEVHSLLKDPNNSKLYLARMGVSLTGTVTQRYYEEIPEDIAAVMLQSKDFAISPDFGYLFYNDGNKVYEYDFNLKQSKVVLDKGAEQITLMKFENKNNIPSSMVKQLHVFTYDESTQNGALELYTVPPVNGMLDLEQRFEGLGKVVSSTYRRR